MTKTLTTVNRRKFLNAVGTGVLTVPQIVASAVLAAQSDKAPNSRIVLGFIGVGWKGFEGCWGSLLQTFIREPGAHVAAVCDVDRRYLDRAKSYVDKYYGNSDCLAFRDFRDLLARPEIDAVVIATPDHWHAVMTIMACQQGKDVYCEKPLSLTIREGRAMVDAARRLNRVVQTGSQSRSNKNLRQACEMIRQGYIGEVREIFATCGGPPAPCLLPAEPTPDYLDFDMWLGPAPARPYHQHIHPMHFRAWQDYSGGGMTDWGAHHFDLAQWALGMDHSGPVEITPPDGKETKFLTFRYANGVKLYHSGHDVTEGVTCVGSEGKANLFGIAGRASFEPDSLNRRLSGKVFAGNDLFSNSGHYANFLECIRTRRRPVADVEIGCRSVTVCHLGNIAYALKRPLKWDPVKEEFPGDADANRFLQRAIREPWRL